MKVISLIYRTMPEMRQK